MNPFRAQRVLTKEIIDELNLPEDLFYKFIHLRIKMAMGIGFDMGRKSHNKGKMVVQMFSNGKIRNIYTSGKEAGGITGIKRQAISACCRGRQITAGGYRWKFMDPNDFYVRMSVKEKNKNNG